MGIAETITVVSKSGKAVATTNGLKSIIIDAHTAYKVRKKEIKAERLRNATTSAESSSPTIHQPEISENESDDSGFTSSANATPTRGRSPNGFPAHDGEHSRSRTYLDPQDARSKSRLRNVVVDDETQSDTEQAPALPRRRTDLYSERPAFNERSASTGDMENEPEPAETPPLLPKRKKNDVGQLTVEVSKLQMLLDEASCVQHSATETISGLTKDPARFAAVACSMGQISKIVRKMPPGTLTALKGAFPVVVALLLSPEFMIAAGVGVGVTVIALGGYKIVQRVKRKTADKAIADKPLDIQKLQELDTREVEQIKVWRQGLAIEDSGVSTPVEAEFATPAAEQLLIDEGVIRKEDGKQRSKSKTKDKKEKDKHERTDSARREPREAVVRLKSLMNGEQGSFKALFEKNKSSHKAESKVLATTPTTDASTAPETPQ